MVTKKDYMNIQSTEKWLASALLGSSVTISFAQEDLGETTVVASKFEQSLSEVSSSVDSLDIDKLLEQGDTYLQDALGYRIPGVVSTSTAGQRGQIGSLFLRGTSTDHSQIRIDGVRISDSNSSTSLFLGSGSIHGIGSLEVLKGSHSALYGGEAIGGVLSLQTARGEGKGTQELYFEGGSFDSFSTYYKAQGEVGQLAYSLGLSYEDTSNDERGTDLGYDYDNTTLAGRFDYTLKNEANIGFTIRKTDSEYETPEFGPQDSEADQLLLTLFAEQQINDIWETKITAGYYESDLDIEAAFPFDSEFEQISLYWDNSLKWTDTHKSVAGISLERADFESSNVEEEDRSNVGVYINHQWKLSDIITANGGVRFEDHDDFGSEVTWNFGAVANASSTTQLKFNIGKGFRTPTFSELNGSAFSPGNDDLDPETSLGWDIGVEQKLGKTLVKATWFETDIEDQISVGSFGFPSFGIPASATENLGGKQKASGLELSVSAEIPALKANAYASYTYYDRALETIIPQQSAFASIDFEITENLKAGLTGTWVDERSFGSDLDDYILVDFFANYAINDTVSLHLRVENVFDETYRINNFDPVFENVGRGRGVFGGVKFTW